MISLTVEWDALRNNLRFQKFSAPKRIPVELFNPVKGRGPTGLYAL
jgi:hypothetical protein